MVNNTIEYSCVYIINSFSLFLCTIH